MEIRHQTKLYSRFTRAATEQLFNAVFWLSICALCCCHFTLLPLPPLWAGDLMASGWWLSDSWLATEVEVAKGYGSCKEAGTRGSRRTREQRVERCGRDILGLDGRTRVQPSASSSQRSSALCSFTCLHCYLSLCLSQYG